VSDPSTPIQHVSDTAFWVAVGRAIESDRKDALFHDPLAARLVEGRGREMASRMLHNAGMAWSMAIRTCIIDDFVREAVAAGIDTVVNLGAGLDTRPYRLDLPAGFRWIEADFPEIIAFKQDRLRGETARCGLISEGLDLSDDAARRAFLGRTAAHSARALVLTEGVLPYLTPAQVGALAADLRAQPHLGLWIVDRFTPAFMAMSARSSLMKQLRNAPFQFNPADWEAFFQTHGWSLSTMKWYGPESRRLRRAFPTPWWMKPFLLLMPPAKRRAWDEMVGYALLEPAAPALAGSR